MQTKVIKKRDGFKGQKAIVIPRKILNIYCENNALLSGLYITDIGYYPRARFRYRKRINGAEQHIIVYCVEGAGNLVLNKERYRIEAGHFFIVPKNTEHTYEADNTNPWTIYWVHFMGSISDNFIQYLQAKYKSCTGFIRHSEQRIELFNGIYNQLERGYSIENMVYSGLCFYTFLASFIHPEKTEHPKQLPGIDHVNEVISFMKKNIHAICTLQQMAMQVNLSSSHLSFLFKKKTGYSPREYFNHLKVQQACQYLMFTNLRIKEIAGRLGMEDPYYFSRFFSKLMGIPPNTYRAKKNEERLKNGV